METKQPSLPDSGKKEKALIYFDRRITVGEAGLILFLDSSKPLNKENPKDICVAFSNIKMLCC